MAPATDRSVSALASCYTVCPTRECAWNGSGSALAWGGRRYIEMPEQGGNARLACTGLQVKRELGGADADTVAVLQWGAVAYARTVVVGAVGAAQVLQPETVARALDEGVAAGCPRVRHDDLVLRAAAQAAQLGLQG